MTRAVRRWSVPPTGLFTLAMPAGARLLTAQPQGTDNVVLWALIEELAPKVARHFLLCMTGAAIDTSLELEHVATVQTATDPVVEFHLFEVKGRPVARVAAPMATSVN